MNPKGTFEFQAIGADWEIDTEQPLPEKLPQKIRSVTEDFDRVWSRFRADSLVTRIARAEDGGRFVFPPRDLALFELYDRLATATDGAVPLIGRDLELLGYDARYSLDPDAAAQVSRLYAEFRRSIPRRPCCRGWSMPATADERPVPASATAASPEPDRGLRPARRGRTRRYHRRRET